LEICLTFVQARIQSIGYKLNSIRKWVYLPVIRPWPSLGQAFSSRERRGKNVRARKPTAYTATLQHAEFVQHAGTQNERTNAFSGMFT
jgi:hypothetical protein